MTAYTSDLQSIKRNLILLRGEWERTVASFPSRKFDPDQPRVPAGTSGGGRWTSSTEGDSQLAGDPDIVGSIAGAFETVAASPMSASFCWNQMQIDMMLCASLIPPWRAAACRAQANERYSACLTGKPIPPLPF
jgi:hypothetical protein